jgi:hypothetical protein
MICLSDMVIFQFAHSEMTRHSKFSTAENLFPLCQMVERGVWEEPSDARLAHVCHDPRDGCVWGTTLVCGD